MDASLDTDILIHLYTANMESILFSLFDTLYLHDYLYHNELFKKAPDDVWERIEDDIESEKIVIVDFKFLENLGMQEVFSEILSE